ncbi:MAG: FAD:protein FMN transferase, partial [Bacteroidota bacterium]
MVTVGPIKALGTVWYIECFDVEVDADELQAETEHVLLAFESKYSRFIPDSLVSTLNREKVLRYPPEQLRMFLQHSLDFYIATNGVFNVAIG